MSGLSAGRPPASLEDVVRGLLLRVAALEQRNTLRAGTWVIYENPDGDLVATSPSGNTVTLSDKPQQVIVRQTTGEEGS